MHCSNFCFCLSHGMFLVCVLCVSSLHYKVIPDSLWPPGLQHTRLPCPSLSPRVCSNSCLLSWWCCLTISFSAIPLFLCHRSFPTSGSFSTSWLFTSDGQSIGAWASASVFPVTSQGWFPLGLTGLTMVHLQNYTLLFHVPFFLGCVNSVVVMIAFSWCLWITCCVTLFVEPLLCVGYSEACVPYL